MKLAECTRVMVVVCARVPAAEQKADLDWRVARVAAWATRQDMTVSRVATEVGYAQDGRCKTLLGLLRDPAVTTIVVGHPDEFARLGVECVEAALSAQDRLLLLADPAVVDDDLVGNVAAAAEDDS
jgi:predicted site-specific integrase-resolvase